MLKRLYLRNFTVFEDANFVFGAVYEWAAPLLALRPATLSLAEPARPGDWSRLTYPRLLVQQYAEAFLPDDAARYHLLRRQAEALETEVAALAALLAG